MRLLVLALVAMLAGGSSPPPTLHGVARHPHAVDVLVNKRVRLPDGFVARPLVVPDVPFTFAGFQEKRQLRRVAARALQRLFAAARADGVPLAGVSGYRSEARQRQLFDAQVRRRGYAMAVRLSAQPRHSEHETGLAIDVSGADGVCQATSCFAGTPAARWLAVHAAEHGWIVRYPAGQEQVTGYIHEPWHLRYLGRRLARAVADSGLAYDAYLARERRRERRAR
jgi:zinc D-Ala-D-Ala carboxypeptidase